MDNFPNARDESVAFDFYYYYFFTNINICFKIMLCDSCILDWFVILGTCVTNTEVVLSFDLFVCVCVQSCERFAQKERERERGERKKRIGAL